MNEVQDKRRFRLTFPHHLTDQPILYQLVRDYDLVLNIRRAQVLPDQTGVVSLEIQGPAQSIDRAITFLRAQGIEVTEHDRELGWDPEACVDCGACLPLCQPGALHRLASGRVTLDRARCTLCGDCVQLCAYGALWIER